MLNKEAHCSTCFYWFFSGHNLLINGPEMILGVIVLQSIKSDSWAPCLFPFQHRCVDTSYHLKYYYSGHGRNGECIQPTRYGVNEHRWALHKDCTKMSWLLLFTKDGISLMTVQSACLTRRLPSLRTGQGKRGVVMTSLLIRCRHMV